MIENTVSFRVRFNESSVEEIAHHSSYVPWLELARQELIRKYELPYKELSKLGVHMTVVDMRIQFMKALFFDDLLSIRASISEKPGLRVFTDYELRRGEELTAVARTEQVFISGAGTPARPPKPFMELVGKHF